MNTVTITGNVTDKPSAGTTDAGTKYCRFAVAVSRKIRKDGSWEDKLDGYFKVVAWRTLAESCSKLEKGTRVQISGSLQQRSWLSDDATRNQVVEIGDPLPQVWPTFDDGRDKKLFEYYPDEISFQPSDFTGLTAEEARLLKFGRDRAHLQS